MEKPYSSAMDSAQLALWVPVLQATVMPFRFSRLETSPPSAAAAQT